MTTQIAGKLGGQYSVRCVTDDIYMVAGLLHGELRTIYKGDYKSATKLMDYCVHHDGEAQAAIQALYFEADPTPLTDLLRNAEEDQVAKPRRRVQCWVRVATDILESENAIDMVSARISAAAGLAGLTITQLEVHYADPNEKFVDPPVFDLHVERDTEPTPNA